MSDRQGVRFPVWTEQLWAVVEMDLRKLRHDPSELFTRMLQPIIWILIFGQAMAKANIIHTGSMPYLDYIVPGILAQSILLIAIFYGIAVIWEKDMGSLHKLLVSPAPRGILVFGRAFAAGIRGIFQAVMIYLLSTLLQLDLRLDVEALLGILGFTVLTGALFSTFSLIVASLVKRRERFMGIGQALTMPLFFASNALYPTEMMPPWLRTLSQFNPLTYLVDGLRTFMIAGQTSHFGIGFDFTVGILVFIALVAICTRLYPRILF